MSTTAETPSGSRPRGTGNQGGKMTLIATFWQPKTRTYICFKIRAAVLAICTFVNKVLSPTPAS